MNEENNNQQTSSNENPSNQPPLAPANNSVGRENGSSVQPPLPPANRPVPPVEPWPEPVDGNALLGDILAELRRFIVFPKYAAETIALWGLHTYAAYLRDVATYLAIESPERECGKSTLLTVLLKLVFRPLPSANISAPAFYRAIEEFQPTLLIDEADTILRGREELRGILNAGYTRSTGFVWRVSYDPIPSSPNASIQPSSNSLGNSASGHLVRFSCWGPKAIASIGRVNETLASRCIVISMQRKTDGEECARLKHLNTLPLQRKCLRFVLDHAGAIANAEPKIPAGLTNRAADIWEPLLILADLAGGPWPELAREAAVKLTARAHEHSPIGALLLDILLVFTSNNIERVFSRDLVANLNRFCDRPWAELRKGKPITELWLAQQLRRYGIRPRSMRINNANAKGYVFEDFRDTFKRYIPRSAVEALKAELAQAAEPPPPPTGPPQQTPQNGGPPSSM